MMQVRGLFAAIFFFLFSCQVAAQDTLRLSRAQCEALFLKENLLLLSEKLHITQADAELLQARLWPNPTFEMDEVNLWVTPAQKKYMDGDAPGGLGTLPYRQATLSIEQLIQTAGKRRKLIDIHQVSADKARQYFEELLRGLKLELRQQLTQLQYLQAGRALYSAQLSSLRQLVAAYEGQVRRSYASRADYMRLKAEELELAREISDLEQDMHEAQKELNLLLRLPATTALYLLPDGFLKDTRGLAQWSLPALTEKARENRPDYLLAILDQEGARRQLRYEKASAVPDLYLKGGYDRGSGIYPNYVGFGVAMDLPLFNRNQGNIRAARAGVEIAQKQRQFQELTVENEAAAAYKNLLRSLHFYEQIAPDYEQSLDGMLDSYTRNFTSRNISMLEYLDFLEAFLNNKRILLASRKEITDRAEELNYAVGVDILP